MSIRDSAAHLASFLVPLVLSKLNRSTNCSINQQIRSIHKARPVTRKPDHGISNLLRLAHAAHPVGLHLLRKEVRHATLDLAPEAILHIDITRRHAVGPHAILGQSVAQLADVMQQRRLEATIRTGSREVNVTTGHRRDVNNVSLAQLQKRRRSLNQRVRPLDIGGKRGVPVLRRVQHRKRRDVRHNDIDAPVMRVRHRLHPRLDLVRLADVDGGAMRLRTFGELELLGSAVDVGGGAGAKVYYGALVKEALYNGVTYGFGAA